MLVTTPAVILSTLRYSESSKIVRLATREHGVQSAIAKGALRPRSRFGAALQVLSEGTAHLIILQRRELQMLTAFDVGRGIAWKVVGQPQGNPANVERGQHLQFTPLQDDEMRGSFAQHLERGPESATWPERTLGDGALDTMLAGRQAHDLGALAVTKRRENDGRRGD